jgi:hypothetical protein
MVTKMNLSRSCKALNDRGLPCGQPPQHESDFCYWHDPANEKDAAEARRLGGLNRKRERTLQEVYDVDGLGSTQQIQRLLEIAVAGVLGLENSLNRSRVLIAAAMAAARVLETGELEKRVQSIEQVLQPREPKPEQKKRGWWPR